MIGTAAYSECFTCTSMYEEIYIHSVYVGRSITSWIKALLNFFFAFKALPVSSLFEPKASDDVLEEGAIYGGTFLVLFIVMVACFGWIVSKCKQRNFNCHSDRKQGNGSDYECTGLVINGIPEVSTVVV